MAFYLFLNDSFLRQEALSLLDYMADSTLIFEISFDTLSFSPIMVSISMYRRSSMSSMPLISSSYAFTFRIFLFVWKIL